MSDLTAAQVLAAYCRSHGLNASACELLPAESTPDVAEYATPEHGDGVVLVRVRPALRHTEPVERSRAPETRAVTILRVDSSRLSLTTAAAQNAVLTRCAAVVPSVVDATITAAEATRRAALMGFVEAGLLNLEVVDGVATWTPSPLLLRREAAALRRDS